MKKIESEHENRLIFLNYLDNWVKENRVEHDGNSIFKLDGDEIRASNLLLEIQLDYHDAIVSYREEKKGPKIDVPSKRQMEKIFNNYFLENLK